MSGGGAPKPDPQMGEAAKMSAETGKEMMAFMKDQAEVTNKWAADDRARYERDFVPLEAEYAADALAAQDKEKIGLNADQRASEAVADVRQQFSMQRDADNRRLRSMGVRPDSGRDAALASSRGSAEALATAGAANMGRRQSILQDEAKADGMRANAINMGKGMAVNPGTAMGISNGAAQKCRSPGVVTLPRLFTTTNAPTVVPSGITTEAEPSPPLCRADIAPTPAPADPISNAGCAASSAARPKAG